MKSEKRKMKNNKPKVMNEKRKTGGKVGKTLGDDEMKLFFINKVSQLNSLKTTFAAHSSITNRYLSLFIFHFSLKWV
jgi:hypothetical protein